MYRYRYRCEYTKGICTFMYMYCRSMFLSKCIRTVYVYEYIYIYVYVFVYVYVHACTVLSIGICTYVYMNM